MQNLSDVTQRTNRPPIQIQSKVVQVQCQPSDSGVKFMAFGGAVASGQRKKQCGRAKTHLRTIHDCGAKVPR